MQLEAHVLQPFVMGRAVSIHPLAVVLGIATGGVLAGIIGALLAVPAIAFFNSFVRVLIAEDPDERGEALESESGPLIDAQSDDDSFSGPSSAHPQRVSAGTARGHFTARRAGTAKHIRVNVSRNQPAPCQIGHVRRARQSRYVLTNAPSAPRKSTPGTAAAHRSSVPPRQREPREDGTAKITTTAT